MTTVTVALNEVKETLDAFRDSLVDWLEQCDAFELTYTDPEDYTTAELAREVNRQYDGGIGAFLRDSA